MRADTASNHLLGASGRAAWHDPPVDEAEQGRAIAAATALATEAGLDVQRSEVLQSSNKLALRLEPAGVLARIARLGEEVAQQELDVARRLVELGAPVAAPDPRVAPQVQVRDSFAVTFWVHHEQVATAITPDAHAHALAQLHEGMRSVHGSFPHATDRVDEALGIVAEPHRSPSLEPHDRDLLDRTLQRLRAAVVDHPAEQLLHGEPHPGNVLSTRHGPLFIDLETCCRGPVELDVAHLPEAVADRYPGADPILLQDCRELVLALVAAWRWDSGDQFPDGARFGQELLRVLRAGPPWPTLDAVVARLGQP